MGRHLIEIEFDSSSWVAQSLLAIVATVVHRCSSVKNIEIEMTPVDVEERHLKPVS